MGKEVLAIPEEYLADVIRVLRAGLTVEEVSEEVAEALNGWCDEMEAFPGDGDKETSASVPADVQTQKTQKKPKGRSGKARR